MADTEAKATGRPCVFCGATHREITKEHVWPKWLRHHVEGANTGEPIRQARSLRTREGETLASDHWRHIPIDARVKDVCRVCNEGWMEHLEGLVRPYLVPLLTDERIVLDPIAQTVLAQWATLRVMVAQYMHPLDRRAVPDLSYRRFYETRQPPMGAQVWIGRRNGEGSWPVNYLHVGLHLSLTGGPDPELPNGYLAAFAIGYVAFICSGHEIEHGPQFRIPGLWPYFRAILPAGPDLNWPLPGLIGESGLDAALRMFPLT